MAQKGLFGITPRGGRKNDSKLLSQKKSRKDSVQVTYISGDNLRDAVNRAKSMSKRILADVLDRLELVDDFDRLDEYIGIMIENGIGALDVETNGLDTIHDELVGVCLYTPGEKGIYVPINHRSNMTKERIKKQINRKDMKMFLEELIEEEVKIVYHNAKFDIKSLFWQLGVKMEAPEWDTYIAGMLLNENESHSLKELYAKYVKDDETSEKAKFSSLFKGIPFGLIPPDVAYMYAAYDPIQTYELYEFQKAYLTPGTPECESCNLERVSEVYHNIELPLIKVLFDMEIYGVRLDEAKLAEIREDFESKMAEAEEEFNKEVAKYAPEIEDLRTFNFQQYQKLSMDGKGNVTVSISSSTQLAILFYDILGLKSNDDRTPRGTGVDIVKSWDIPIARALLKYRKYAKLVSTYTTLDDHLAKPDNRIHTTFKQYGAKTGRMSSEGPNLQNIFPPEEREQ